jgi:hypothetical protein
MKKKLIITAIVIIAAIGTYAYFNFGQIMDLGMKLTASMKHRDPSKEKAAFTLSADSLYGAYKTDAENAKKKYLNQAVLVEGNVSAIQDNNVSLNNVACNIDSTEMSKIKEIKVGDKVKLQGVVVGYNELMDEIDISQCTFK